MWFSEELWFTTRPVCNEKNRNRQFTIAKQLKHTGVDPALQTEFVEFAA